MTRKGIKLVAPDMNGAFCYQGNCKIKIDTVSEVLKIEPKNEDYPDISVMFEWKWKFIKQKNILFVFSENKIQDFVLIFANEETCKKVHEAIYKNREKDSIEKGELQQRLLIPIFQIISKTIFSSRFKRAIREWIENHETQEKFKLLKLLKEQKNGHQIMDVKNIKKEIVRKRRFSEMENDNPSINEEENNDLMDNGLNNVNRQNDVEEFHRKNKKSISLEIKIIEESRFKIVNFKFRNGFHRKLLIFTSDAKTHCYEYYLRSKKQNFNHRCFEGAKGFKAVLKLDEEGKEFIKFEDKKHACSPIKYNPENYFELKIVKKPNYEILDNCSSKSKRLFIFDSNDRNFCYEYCWRSRDKKFRCRGCEIKKKNITAGIIHENTEFEYIMLLNNGHVCEKRKYNPQKFNQVKKFVLSPNFEIQTRILDDGRKAKTLIIFNGNNRKMCYTYFFNNSANRYRCNGCNGKQKQVSAKICQNDDGEEYVILSNAEHICSPKIYAPQTNQIILRPPNIKFMKSNEKYRSKLFIFDSKNINLCYTFSKHHKRSSRKYYCLGCSKSTQHKKTFFVSLYKDDDGLNNGEYYVKMVDGQKHFCKPQKYEPEKYEIKILKPKDDYILFREKQKDSLSLAVFYANDKSFCYSYYYHSGNKIFRCKECEKKKAYLTLKLHQDSDGNECIISNQNKHVCKPIKKSSIIKADTIILEKSGLNFDESKKNIDESRIIRLPNFELQRNIKGVPERKLVIFKNDDKKFCYEYKYDKGSFFCNKCRITAKVYVNSENGEKYVILGPNEHSCDPVKYESEKKIIESSDFMIFNRDDNSKMTKLIIFTSSEKIDCYEYSFNKQNKCFRCVGCSAMKKIISAKSLVNDNGEETIQLLKNDHICTSKKFVLEEFQPKTVPESEFKLCSNKNGKANSKLILFDPEKDGFGYEYFLHGKNVFICNQCERMKKHVTAKLCKKENGEKYLELSVKKHVCESTKYESEKFNKKVIINNFVVQFNKDGDPNSRLTIFDENDKTLGYQYSFRKSQNAFFCLKCNKIFKTTTAKLLMDGNGKQTVEFGKNEHVCEIQNLKENNLIFDNFKLEENGNTLITTDSKKKFYKFKYNSDLDVFCCMKCKEKKKKIITATICKDKNEKEFVVLNDVHCCVPFSK